MTRSKHSQQHTKLNCPCVQAGLCAAPMASVGQGQDKPLGAQISSLWLSLLCWSWIRQKRENDINRKNIKYEWPHGVSSKVLPAPNALPALWVYSSACVSHLLMVVSVERWTEAVDRNPGKSRTQQAKLTALPSCSFLLHRNPWNKIKGEGVGESWRNHSSVPISLQAFQCGEKSPKWECLCR